VSWNAAKRPPPPVAARATSAIWVESPGGRPTRSFTATAVRPIVSQPTIASVSHRVTRPKCTFPRWSSCPSCATADDGASTPVASAIATGNASSTASGSEPWAPAGWSTPEPCPWGATRPSTSTADPTATNDSVMSANTALPAWPNQVRPATAASRTRASGTRTSPSDGR